MATLFKALEQLDQMLAGAVVVADTAYGSPTSGDGFQGLCIAPAEVIRLLARPPGTPVFGGASSVEDALQDTAEDAPEPLAWLTKTYALSPFDVWVLLLALAPEIDLKYERIYGFLQDDVNRRRPTVNLALDLLCDSPATRLSRRSHFAPEAPLLRHGLLHLLPDPQHPHPPLLAHSLALDDLPLRALLGQSDLDVRLTGFCRLVTPAADFGELPLRATLKRTLITLGMAARQADRPLFLHFLGGPGMGKRSAAEALAAELKLPLLYVDLVRAFEREPDLAPVLRRLWREAAFQDALLYLDGLDALLAPERAAGYNALLAALPEARGLVILAGELPWTLPLGEKIEALTIAFSPPDAAERRACWRAQLTAGGITVPDTDLEALADRFRLTPGQITQAVTATQQRARLRAAEQGDEAELPPIPATDLFYAARIQSGQDLGALAQKITPTANWTDIVLPEEAVRQLRSICDRVTHRRQVLEQWGFGRKLSYGTGVGALFAGPSGTGKTMAAEIIAHTLELDLYKIDLSGIVSKYIGETEKNLNTIFAAAARSNAILFFDEADALFGKRSEVRDAHDRYANIEVAYLLQKLEQYEGVALLASNLRQNMDDAFVRRLAFIVTFPFPDEAHRERIWRGVWPREAQLAEDLNWGLLAREVKLSGGHIKNIALDAAYLAAATGGPITMACLGQAARREYEKLGNVPPRIGETAE